MRAMFGKGSAGTAYAVLAVSALGTLLRTAWELPAILNAYQPPRELLHMDDHLLLRDALIKEKHPHVVSEVFHEPTPLAQTATDFRIQLAFERYHVDGDAAGAAPFVYSDQDIHLILRAFYAMRGLNQFGMWSGSDAASHFLGTASCMLQLHQPALAVAFSLIHSTYVQDWRPMEGLERYDECSSRAKLASLLGKELEAYTWTTTALFTHGPWDTCIDTYLELRQLQKTQTQLDEITQRTLDWFASDEHLTFAICDNIDEVLSGNQLLGGNWKRRPHSTFDNMADLALSMNKPKLASWVRMAQKRATVLHPVDPPTDGYKSMSPPDLDTIFATETFHPLADPTDITRLRFVTATSKLEQSLQPKWLPPLCVPRLCRAVRQSRDLCDAIVANTTNAEEYLDQNRKLVDDLQYCERNSDLYRNNSWEMPQIQQQELIAWPRPTQRRRRRKIPSNILSR